jgi:hypothetical protein
MQTKVFNKNFSDALTSDSASALANLDALRSLPKSDNAQGFKLAGRNDTLGRTRADREVTAETSNALLVAQRSRQAYAAAYALASNQGYLWNRGAVPLEGAPLGQGYLFSTQVTQQGTAKFLLVVGKETYATSALLTREQAVGKLSPWALQDLANARKQPR